MLDVSISNEGLDPEWDDFLETRPDGCYQQSSLWARLKSILGWQHLRVVVRNHGEIIGGAQMMLRPVRKLGAVGYISKGPVVASDDPAVQQLVLDQLDDVARKEHILFLKMQPSYGAEDVAQRLLERGATPSEMIVVSPATARVDLRPEPEEIMARMPRKKRQDIRRGERRGVTVREGTEADMSTFLRLQQGHSKRREFGIAPKRYYHQMWSLFASRGSARLFVAEHEGEPLALMVNICFGDVDFAMVISDTGSRMELNAHSVLHWKAMLWGREMGCAWYDFNGINLPVAKAILNNEPLPDTRRGRLDRFKMSFGSQVMLRPGA